MVMQRCGKTRMSCFKPAQSEVAGAKIQIAGPPGEGRRFVHVLDLHFFGWLLDVSVCILCEPAGRSEKQAAVFGTLRKQAFDKLEAEWNRLAYKFRVVVRGKSSIATGQRVPELVDGKFSNRAAG